jgi:citrate synthase
LIIYGDIPSIN